MSKKRFASIVLAFLMVASIAINVSAAPPADRTYGDAAGGYMNLAYIYSGNIETFDYSVLTHVNYAFGLVYNQEYLLPNGPGAKESWNNVDTVPGNLHKVYLSNTIRNNLRRLNEIKAEKNPDLQILLSIGGDGARGFSAMARTPESRAIFIQSCLELVDEFSLDGVDLDWEFPCMDGWGHKLEHSPDDKDNFTALVRELREALGDDKLITMAGSADEPFSETWVDIPALAELFDFINLMTYDFQYGSSFFGYNLGSSRLWSTSGSISNDISVEHAVGHYVSAGYPREKINIGYTCGAIQLPENFRGATNRRWNWISNALANSGWNTGANTSLPVWQRIDDVLDGKVYTGTYNDEPRQIEFHKEWDRYAGLETVFAYDLTGDPNRRTKLFVLSYLGPQAMAARAEYIKGTNLAGSFFWQYGNDPQSWLAKTMAGLLSEPYPEQPDPMNLAYIYTTNLNNIGAMDFSAVTHINYAFGLVYNTEYNRLSNVTRESWNTTHTNPELEHTVYLSNNDRNALRRIVEQKNERNPDAKVLLSIGGAGARGFSNMASTPESRAKFIQSCIDIRNEFQLDGIDLDWEFPSMNGWGTLEYSSADKANFTLLLKECREALGDDVLLTIAGSANTSFPISWTNMAEAIQYLDFINLMTYDFHYGTSYFGYALGSSRKWLTRGIGDDYHVDFSVHNYVSAGIPRQKINVGYTTGAIQLPEGLRGSAGDTTTYWSWISSALSASGWNAGANTSLPVWQRVENVLDGKVYSGTYNGDVKEFEFHREWDRYAGLATVFAYNITDRPQRDRKLFVLSYLDKQGLDARTQYVVDNGLLGSFFWQYNGDTQSWLTKTVASNFGIYKPDLAQAIAAYEKADWPGDWAGNAAYDDALAVYQSNTATAEQIGKAAEGLNDINNLYPEITALGEMIAFYGQSEINKFTPATYIPFATAALRAKEIYAKYDATPEEIFDAWSDLNDAKAALDDQPGFALKPEQPKSVKLKVGETWQLQVETNTTLIYVSTAPNVVSVTQAGLLTGIKAGNAVITIRALLNPADVINVVVSCTK